MKKIFFLASATKSNIYCFLLDFTLSLLSNTRNIWFHSEHKEHFISVSLSQTESIELSCSLLDGIAHYCIFSA